MSKFGVVFLLLLLAAAINAAVMPGGVRQAAVHGSRVAANERLTAVNGTLLFVLLTAAALTVLFIGPLLAAHFLVGFVLVPPLFLKIYSTGYRFIQYYRHDRDVRLAGPPPIVLRFAVAPVLVASTVVVMVSGFELWAFADRFGAWWQTVHTVSAAIFMFALFAHLLGHLKRSATALLEDATAPQANGAGNRRSIFVACTILALVLAAASLIYASPYGSIGGGG